MTQNVEFRSADGHQVCGTFTSAEHERASLLMVHGITADRTEWGYYSLLMKAMEQLGVSSLAFDIRGHGHSRMSPNKISLAGVTLDIISADHFLRDKAKHALNRYIIGNSFGGGLSYLYGQQSRVFSRILLSAPVLSYIDDIGESREIWSESSPDETFRYVKFDLSSFLIPEMEYFDYQIDKIAPSTPFTVIHGADDTDVPIEGSRRFVSTRTAGTLVPLDGMDHCWATPGDLPPFEDPRSVRNRMTAVDRTVSILLDDMTRNADNS